MQPEAILLVAFAAVALAFAIALRTARTSRAALVVRGGAGLAGIAAIAAAPTLDLAVLVFLALAVLHAAVPGRTVTVARLRAPVLAVALLVLGLVLAQVQGPTLLPRFAAVGLVAGLAAGVGVLPYVHEFDPLEPVLLSPVVWIAFVGPVFAAAVVWSARSLLPAEAGGAFGAMLIGLGVLNVVSASLGAWRTENDAAAWRYSFLADWGLVLCAFGLPMVDGQDAALLLLFSLVLGRLPLYLVSRRALREKVTTDRPINVVVAAALAGSAPFAAFSARVLLLRAATQLFWPLALVLVLGMLLWIPGSLRLGRTLGAPKGRQAFTVGVVLAINALVGLYPLPILTVAHH